MIRLVLGGVRSGKSRHAESLLAGRDDVTYVAPGPVSDDADWAARVRAHQARRPASWRTMETADVAAAVRAAPGDVLVDCLGTWVTRLVDEARPALAAWDDPPTAHAAVDAAVAALSTALAGCGARTVVLVSNEVGLGVVPERRSGRLFRDALGHVNTVVADGADHVELVVAGRVLDLSEAARVTR